MTGNDQSAMAALRQDVDALLARRDDDDRHAVQAIKRHLEDSHLRECGEKATPDQYEQRAQEMWLNSFRSTLGVAQTFDEVEAEWRSSHSREADFDERLEVLSESHQRLEVEVQRLAQWVRRLTALVVGLVIIVLWRSC